MTSNQALRLLSLAGLGSLLAASSFAQEGGYAYGGLSIGQSQARIDDERITATLLNQGLTTTAMSQDESDLGYKIFAGYQFNRYFGLEGGYFNLGKFGFTSTTTPTGTLNGSLKAQGLNLDLVGTLPITGGFSAIARVGAQYARTQDNFSGGGAVHVLNPSPSERSLNYKAGLGLQYEFNRSVIMRAEAERYRINDAVGNKGDVNLYSVSLVFPFGRAPEAAPRPMAAPAYVAPPPPAPPPPPVVAQAPPPPVVAPPARKRVNFEADSLFTFDQSVVRPDGRAALDKFAHELRGTEFDTITVEGHTDRLGSTAYNQRLSTQRAEAVKTYLVTNGGFNAAKISALGKGESEPVTRAEDCKGNTPTPKLILCLQPDRRVVVEVTGTQ